MVLEQEMKLKKYLMEIFCLLVNDEPIQSDYNESVFIYYLPPGYIIEKYVLYFEYV
jgi:hypothetical protein